ncbi:response regulator [Tardiphaga sp. vice352]|uniref:response regulator n=1 Tax=unclassified Tardiphaga TaxID=2631404 RepID=UPI001164195E|nr:MULTISPECIES: response regulator [unclassified Tardiphaga]QDM15425.1 response regulator [Tardiphaga sp. vice278]QDM25580.1 response regulator [Tardiphaga sp. vice304]QDM30789.1 response regulator [Tardiphaga sp. vice352]
MFSSASPIRILVVEDEMVIRMDVVEMLDAAGFDIFEATNADEAIQMLERNSDIRLVFTDIDMPGSMNGLKLAATVRDRWPPIRIIATSGHFKVRAGDLPADARFIAKPYQAAQIISAVRELTSVT